jgi:5'-3' exonuclease/transcription antitermination factor NusG
MVSAEVFIPATVAEDSGGDRIVRYLMDGYAFIQRSLPDRSYFKLENSRYVTKVLTRTERSREIATIRSAEIEKMRFQILAESHQGIRVGDMVEIASGPYKSIPAKVIEEIPEQDSVQVYVELRSKQSLLTLPRSFLRVINRAPQSPQVTRLVVLKTWLRLAKPILLWKPPSTQQMTADGAIFWQTHTWMRKIDNLITLIGYRHPMDPKKLQSAVKELKKLTRWINKYHRGLVATSDAYHDILLKRLSRIEFKQMELEWLTDAIERGRSLRKEVDTLHMEASQQKASGETMVQNVIVDGHNLAFRCLYAPGISELTDSQGRPTGMILGFLRSLGALKRRFSPTNLIVAWDGSSQRRKAKYSEYKANRKPMVRSSDTWSPIDHLRKLLPLVGVRQAWNPVEEADDVIASLVREELSGQESLIFSTDRDFMQLVSDTTSVLIPAIGSRKEILFNEAQVREHYGVQPSDFVQLRALIGDTSDNIPGVPRVPKKVLKDLIQVYGSVEAVFASKLAGVTKSQYERLRSAEPQVRINLDLMMLHVIPFESLNSNPDVDRAKHLLTEVDINPDPILEGLLGSSGFTQESLSL